MNMNFIKRITKWNEERGNNSGEIDVSLEHDMLLEEVTEFYGSEKDVDKLDALADTIFVAIGSMYKLGLTPQQIDKAINIVCDANEKKLSDKKDNGKISKPVGFVGPEAQLQRILDA